MKVIFILFLVINNTLKHCQAEETVINSDACTAERLKVGNRYNFDNKVCR